MEKDGVLKGSTNPEDYPAIDTRWEGEERKWTACLVNGNDLEGIKLTGEGTIDGSGVEWTANHNLRRQQPATGNTAPTPATARPI